RLRIHVSTVEPRGHAAVSTNTVAVSSVADPLASARVHKEPHRWLRLCVGVVIIVAALHRLDIGQERGTPASGQGPLTRPTPAAVGTHPSPPAVRHAPQATP